MSKKAKVIILSVVSVIVVGVIILALLEGVNKRKLSIVNNTDKNITNLKMYFEDDEEGTVYMDLYEGPLNAGASESRSFKTVDFGNGMADLALLVTFEGEEEIFAWDGFFENRFDGKLDIEFYQEEGQYRVRLKAKTGLFNSTKNAEMDNDLYFDFEASDWYEVGESPEDYIDFSDMVEEGEDLDFDDDEEPSDIDDE